MAVEFGFFKRQQVGLFDEYINSTGETGQGDLRDQDMVELLDQHGLGNRRGQRRQLQPRQGGGVGDDAGHFANDRVEELDALERWRGAVFFDGLAEQLGSVIVVLGRIDDGGARRGPERETVRQRAGHAGRVVPVEEGDAGQRGG